MSNDPSVALTAINVNVNGKGYVYCLYNSRFRNTVVLSGVPTAGQGPALDLVLRAACESAGRRVGAGRLVDAYDEAQERNRRSSSAD